MVEFVVGSIKFPNVSAEPPREVWQLPKPMVQPELSNRERKNIETIKARLLCLQRRIDASETPLTADYKAEKKALEWLLEKAGIDL